MRKVFEMFLVFLCRQFFTYVDSLTTKNKRSQCVDLRSLVQGYSLFVYSPAQYYEIVEATNFCIKNS